MKGMSLSRSQRFPTENNKSFLHLWSLICWTYSNRKIAVVLKCVCTDLHGSGHTPSSNDADFPRQTHILFGWTHDKMLMKITTREEIKALA